MPSHRHDASPAHTGSSSLPPKNAVQTSVPPQIESIRTSGPSCSLSHRQPAGPSGEPVGITVRRPSSASSSNDTPARWQAAA